MKKSNRITPRLRIHHRETPLVRNMEEEEGDVNRQIQWNVVAILVLFLASIFLYVFLERGLEGSIDWFFDGLCGIMFAGLLVGALSLFKKLFKKQEE